MLIENTTFRLLPGVDEAAFLAADARVQVELMLTQPALIRRTTARGEGSTWLVVVLWDGDPEDGAMRGPETAAMLALIDSSSLRVERYTALEG
ncbi:MAG: hypothetical protein QOI47_995 [Actinomycetota bacterium]|nr:hypothetical protein [Actinomycetota bacterium]